MAFDWNQRNIQHLRDMWLKGVSASKIAAAIGNPSANSIIGKANRLGLPGRESPIGKGVANSASTRPREPYDRNHDTRIDNATKGHRGRNNPGGIRMRRQAMRPDRLSATPGNEGPRPPQTFNREAFRLLPCRASIPNRSETSAPSP